MPRRWLSLLPVAVLALAAACASQGVTPPPCSCNANVELMYDPRVPSTNVALTMVGVYKHLQPRSPDGRQRFAILTHAMFDAYGLASGAHPTATRICVDGADAVDPSEAVVYAAYTIMAAAYADEPPKLALLHDLMRHYGYDAPVEGHVGALAARAVMAKYNLRPEAIPYTPLNEPSDDANADCSRITIPDAWQPLCLQRVPGPPCSPQVIRFGGLFNSSLFSSGGTRTAVDAANDLEPPPTYEGALADLPFEGGENDFADEHLAVLKGSAELGDYEKSLAQVFGSSSSDRVARLAIKEAEARNLTLGESAALMFGVAAAIHDASAASTTAKYLTNAARSISVLQCAYAGRNLTAWAGPYLGVRTFLNAGDTRWRSYWFTPGFPGFFSGHTAVAAAGLEVMARVFGDDVPVSANCEMLGAGLSNVEPRVAVGGRGYIPGVTDVPNRGPATVGYSPANDTTLCWPTWSKLGEMVGDSRFYGGIHIPIDNSVGLTVGRDMGRRMFEYVQRVVNGTDGTDE